MSTIKKVAKPTVQQWKELYEAALAIKAQAPWNDLNDSDLFTLRLPHHEEPVFVSVMGALGECYGIGVYPGYQSLENLYRMAEATDKDASLRLLASQNCLVCYYGDRDEITPIDRESMNALGLKFRGKNNWIYFRSMQEGYYPWYLGTEQAQLLIEVLQNFSLAFTVLKSGAVSVDFDAGETLLRTYSAKTKSWTNAAVPMLPIPEPHCTSFCNDDLLVQRLKSKKCDKFSWEIDLFTIPAPVQNNKDEVPYFPRLLLLFNSSTGDLLAQQILDSSDQVGASVLNFLSDYLTTHNKPSRIIVRDKYFLRNVESFCDLLQIPVAHSKGMPCMDEFIEAFSENLSIG